MTACLLSHLNPAVRRIDGSGGDDGRDCQFEDADGLHAFEMKGFSGGRVGKTQRRQVERSLAKAAALNPVAWTLVTPVDPTPAELTWFEGLRKKYPFPLEWKGLTWLDGEFAKRPYIADYYVGTAKEQVYDLLRDIHQEEAGLVNGVPDAINRMNALVEKANNLSAHYRFRIEADGRSSKVTILPAYRGAEVDAPIRVKGEFAFDTTTDEGRTKEEEFQRAMDFGTPTELPGNFVPMMSVDAPAGLGGTFNAPTVTIGPGAPVTTEPLDLTFVVRDPQGAEVASIALNCEPKTSGARGTVLACTYALGYVTADVAIDVKDQKYQVNLHTRWDGFIPNDFAPVVKFLNAYHDPNTVTVGGPNGEGISDPFPCGAGFDMPDALVEFVRNMAVIQGWTGIVRPVTDISGQDVANALGGVALLRGEEVPAPWDAATVTVVASASADTRQQLASNPMTIRTGVDAPFEVMVSGTLYPLGTRHFRTMVARVHPDDLPRLTADEFGEDLVVRLVPDPSRPSTLVKLTG
jgi:hypothetical protein